MDVRKKLAELIREISHDKKLYLYDLCDMFEGSEKITDLLIENGVTVQKCGYWVSLTDCANAGVYCSVCHKKVYKEDYARCNRENKLRSDYCPHCGAKMMPQPPKGE